MRLPHTQEKLTLIQFELFRGKKDYLEKLIQADKSGSMADRRPH